MFLIGRSKNMYLIVTTKGPYSIGLPFLRHVVLAVVVDTKLFICTLSFRRHIIQRVKNRCSNYKGTLSLENYKVLLYKH